MDTVRRCGLAAVIAAVVVASCAPPSDPPTSTRPSGEGDAAVRAVPEPVEQAYGDHPDQVLVLHRPAGTPTGPVVVLVHGGFWREAYRADLMTPLAEDLARRGHVAVNLEYRRVGGAGGYPATLADVAAGIDHLATLDDLAGRDVVTVGHSAGGHLAVWVAARHRLPAGVVGADPLVRPCGAVSQAGVLDLTRATALRLGDGAVSDLLGGGPDEVPDRFAVADPARLVPVGVRLLLVQGADDTVVPPEMHRRFAAAAIAAGDEVSEVTLPGDHLDVIDPDHPAWAAVVEALATWC